MRIKTWQNLLISLLLLLVLTVTPILTGCGGDEKETETTTTETTTTQTEVKEFDVVKDAVKTYLADRAGNMKASDLHLSIAEGNAPYIVSLRSADDYATGHIPGAVNKKFSDLSSLPKNEDILVYCYTGQSASFGAAVLGVMGYDVQNLLHGMSSWSDDSEVYVSRFDPTTSQGDYDVETTANTPGSHDYPILENTTSNDESAIVEAAAKTVSPKYITAADLNMKIAEGEDMTVLSVRSADHYAVGHIPSAINIGLDDLANNLNNLDPDAPVYVYCYTGHSAAQAASLLQMLGYDAYSVKFGMCSWSSDPTVNAGKCFNASTAAGYDTE
ncbi:rhodanese-like domain-containing protein [Chloroflexota bacterium]